MSNGTPWTDRHTDILRRMASVGYTDGEIAAITGHRRETVQRQRQARGIDPCHRVDWLTRICREKPLTLKITTAAYG